MHARLTRFQGPTTSLDESIRIATTQAIPATAQLPGYVGAIFLVDRESGKLVTLSLWETEDHLRESDRTVARWRQQAADAGRVDIIAAERYEVIMDDLSASAREQAN
jgi:hypothetical protein